MRMNARCERRVKISEEEVEDVQKFVYLGAAVCNTSGLQRTLEGVSSESQRAQNFLKLDM